MLTDFPAMEHRTAVKAPFHKSGGAGWVITAAVIIAWDAAAPETMSQAFSRACSTPAGKAVVITGWAIITAHLLSLLPERVDPLLMLVKATKVARYKRIASECAAI